MTSTSRFPSDGPGCQRTARADGLQAWGFLRAQRRGGLEARVDGVAEGDTQLLGDLLRLRHHGGGELAGLRKGADVFQSRMGERADRVEGEVAPGLQPDLRADVVEHPRAEAGLDQQVVDRKSTRLNSSH